MLKTILEHRVTRFTACYLVFSFAGAFSLPAIAQAAFISSSENGMKGVTPGSVEEIKAMLEDELITEHLSDLGLSPPEIEDRLISLSSEEREMFAAELGTVQTGGNSIVNLLILCVLVYFILKMTDKI
jgi:hypothetical protein